MPLVIVRGRGEFHGTKINMPINHFHFIFSSDTNIKESNFIIDFSVSIFLNSKKLGLHNDILT